MMDISCIIDQKKVLGYRCEFGIYEVKIEGRSKLRV